MGKKKRKKAKRRPPKRVPETAQRSLFPATSSGDSSPHPDAPSDFLDPAPGRLFVGDTPLRDYLTSRGLGWIVRLRELLVASDLSGFYAAYQRRGRRAIHPAILLGLIVYGMLERRWSLRALEDLAKRDVGAWWLCGGLQPDHSTIGNFINLHSEILTEAYFIELTRMLVKALRLSPSEASGDGTVIEAVASHYKTLKAEAARQAAEEARQAAEAAPDDKELQATAAQKESVAAVATEREEKRRKVGKNTDGVRVSSTEPEAAIQPLKNGARRPSYKPSALASAEKLIVGKYLDPSNELTAVKPMLEQHQAIYGVLPPRTMLDAGYHKHEILALFVALNLDLLCPSGKADRGEWEEQSRNGKYHKNRFRYDEDRDCYVCPAGKDLRYADKGIDGGGRSYRRFRGQHCGDCELRKWCTKSKSGRTIKRYEGDELKEAMTQVLTDERARKAYGRRKAEVEPVFAELRERQGLTRFHRRGWSGADLEFALHCIAYNLKRAVRLEAARRTGYYAIIRGPGSLWFLWVEFWQWEPEEWAWCAVVAAA